MKKPSPGMEHLRVSSHFTAEDIRSLQEIGTALAPRLSQISDKWYQYLQNDPNTRSYLEDPQQAARMQALQKAWFVDLFAGDYSPVFWERQRQIGERHVDLAMPLTQIDSTFTWLRTALIVEITQIAATQQRSPEPWFQAILILIDDCQQVLHEAYANKRLHDMVLALRQLIGVYDLESFFLKAATLAVAIAQADGAGLIIRAEGQLKYRFFHGLPDAYQAFAHWSFPDNAGTAGAAIQRGEPVYVVDYPHSVYVLPEFADMGLQGSLALPIPGLEGFQGVLAISWFHRPPPARIPTACWDHLRLITDLFGANLYRETIETRLEEHSTRDMLTGLPNRRVAEDRVTTAIARAERHQFLFALIFLDLDGFKPINDRFGHAEGDTILRTVAQDLRQVMRSEDSVLRYAGDEFLILVEDVGYIEGIEMIAQRIVDVVRRDLCKQDMVMPLSASVGISIYPFDDGAAGEIVHHADLAMYAAKQAGGNQWQFYNVEISHRVVARQSLVEDLRLAFERHEFVLHWQPIVALPERQISGAEALLRWQHPTRGLLGPEDFLETLEALPLMRQVGQWVMETAFAQAAQWHAQGHRMNVHINIAAMQLEDTELLRFLAQLLRRYPAIHKGSIWLEIVERVALRDIPATAAMIKACRELGLHFSLDDFGTGAAALQYLAELECSGIKLDKSLVHPMRDSPKHHNMIRAMVDMTRALSIQVVAEGVEDDHTAALLHALGVPCAQGYLFAKPMDAMTVTEMLTNSTALPSDKITSSSST